MPQEDIFGFIAEITSILGWLKHTAFDLSSRRHDDILRSSRCCHVISWGEGTVPPLKALL